MYTKEFYKKYEEYLHEPSVRKSHDWIFSILKFNNCFDYVIDLGCGIGEFKRYFKPRSYMGIDINFEDFNVKNADYRNCDIKKLIGNFKPMAFVSLFSAEITASVAENYSLYEKLFRELKVKTGLVSSFYYANKKSIDIVRECGINSYQCLENVEDVRSEVFTEKRIILPVPSKLFGNDVYEVWKILDVK